MVYFVFWANACGVAHGSLVACLGRGLVGVGGAGDLMPLLRVF